jgi:hypothetical protein
VLCWGLMTGRLPFPFGLVALAAALTAAACSSISSNPGSPDGSTTTPDAESDALPEDFGPNACTDASVVLIKASNYDQSCTVDTDCRVIAEGNACTPCAFDCTFGGGAVNASALMKYKADIANTPATASQFDGQVCGGGCPAAFGACCVAGKCQTSTTNQCPVPADAGDACATPTVCNGACVSGAHNVTTMVDGCLVSRCCVVDDAGADAASDSGSADGSADASRDAIAE